MTAFLGRRVKEITGICLVLLACVLTAALFSPGRFDPSLSAYSSGDVRNWFGGPGAAVAGFLRVAFGGASFFVTLYPLGWGYRLIRKQDVTKWPLRLCAAPFGVFCLAAGVFGLSGAGSSAAGGAVGVVILGYSMEFVAPTPFDVAGVGAETLFGIGFLALGLFVWSWSVTLSRRHWAAAFMSVFGVFGRVGRAGGQDTGHAGRTVGSLALYPFKLLVSGSRLVFGAGAARRERRAERELAHRSRTREEMDLGVEDGDVENTGAAAFRRAWRAGGAGGAAAAGGAAVTSGRAEGADGVDGADRGFDDAGGAGVASGAGRTVAGGGVAGSAAGTGASGIAGAAGGAAAGVAGAAHGAGGRVARGDRAAADGLEDALDGEIDGAPPPTGRKAERAGSRKGRKRQEPVLIEGAGQARAKAPAGSVGPAQTKMDFDGGRRFKLPSDRLLTAPGKTASGPSKKMLEETAQQLENVLGDFGVKGEIADVRYGPVVTRYDLVPSPGTKSQRVIALADDIARSLSAISVRVAVVPGQNVIGIELPNTDRQIVVLREVMNHPDWTEDGPSLAMALGKDIAGTPVIVDLASMPHLLVAGTTGSGKSVGVNAMILSLLYRHTPETCRMILVDPKMLELSVYHDIPHLLSPVVTEPAKAVTALKWAVREMENRYRNMAKLSVRNIAGYNKRVADARDRGEVVTRRVQTGFDAETGKPVHENEVLDLSPLPFIVVVIDEVADLMLVAGKEIEAAVQRLAQMARAAGIHVIMATQRPSVDVITGTIKANFPTRISFQVTSRIDSRTILGEQGAEQLLGRGDMLFMEGGGRVVRVHGPFVSDGEVEAVAEYLRKQGAPEYNEKVVAEEEQQAEPGGVGGDDGAEDGGGLYEQAVGLVIRQQKASTSFLQRHLKIGYNRAATIIEEMEQNGVISAANHVGRRDVLISDEEGE